MIFVDNETVIQAAWLNKVEKTVPSEGNIVLAKASGNGIKVDTSTPTYPWRDLEGAINVKEVGGSAPAFGTFRTGIRAFSFGVGEKADFCFHVPHDYVPGTDLFIHTHWSHNGTNISGTLQMEIAATYAKGFEQATFSAPVLGETLSDSLSIANHPQYMHIINETPLSTPGGNSSLLDTNKIEVDGLILVTATAITIPTITGGTPNEPFIFTIDIHYQSTGVGTKNRYPGFYS